MKQATDEVIMDRLRVLELVGLYCGQLDEDELRMFDEACKAGIAYRDYNCLGLAKVAIR